MPDGDSRTTTDPSVVVLATLRALGADPGRQDVSSLPGLAARVRRERDTARNRCTALRGALAGCQAERERLVALAARLRQLAAAEAEIGGDDDDGEQSDNCDSPAVCHAEGRMRAYHRAAIELEGLLGLPGPVQPEVSTPETSEQGTAWDSAFQAGARAARRMLRGENP